MTSFVPRVKFSQLLWYFFKSSAQNYYVQGGYSNHFLSRSSWSLKIISEFLKKKQDGLPINYWIPAYFCNQALAEVRKTDANLIFYPVDENLEPNWERCKELAKENTPQAFLLVHYFGRISNSKIAKKFCDLNKCVLIEDATHFVKPVSGFFEYSDFVISSPYKFFPLPEGAVLYSNQSSQLDFKLLNVSANKWGLRWLLKSLIKMLFPAYLYNKLSKTDPDFDLDSLVTNPLPRLNPSRISLNYLSHVDEELIENISKLRKQNFQKVKDLLEPKEINNFNDYYKVAFTFMIKNENAKSIYTDLCNSGIPCAPWPDLPPEVLKRHDSLAVKIKDQVILIPVYEGIKYAGIN